MADYKVLDIRPVFYTARDGGDLKKFIPGEVIRQSDIDAGYITIGALKGLEADGVVQCVSSDDPLSPDDKKMPKGSKKDAKKEGGEDETN